ncbi:MAG: outer membrane protein assembly factor BamD [Thermodesulfobacteriota bacterium]
MIIASDQNLRARRLALGLLLLFLAAGLGGCSTMDTMLGWVGFGSDKTGTEQPEVLAMRGMDDFNRGKYHTALQSFDEIKNRFPFSEVALLAELKSADSNYYMDKFGEAKTLYEEFEANHPTNEAIPYVLFQIAMCHYKQIGTSDRDPGNAMLAVQSFERLNRSFPQSPYLVEASARAEAARDFLAQHEFSVASFYVRTDEYGQAQRRLEYLLATYPKASVVGQASELLAQLKSGNPPSKSWMRFVPTVSLPDWKSFTSAFGVMPGGSAPAGN